MLLAWVDILEAIILPIKKEKFINGMLIQMLSLDSTSRILKFLNDMSHQIEVACSG